jgi:iron complex outermembrane receptor protein
LVIVGGRTWTAPNETASWQSASVAVPLALFAVNAFAVASPDPSDHELEDIIVTARKREERADKVPVSVTVISAADLDATYTSSLVDLTHALPNAVFHTVGEFGHSSSLDIRGVGGGGANFDTDPAVAIYVDGQYQTANTINLESLAGVESIEVLRGPQGTLFGRNAFAGAINVTTKNPDGMPGTEAQITAGNYGRRDLTAALEAPLTDSLAWRVDLAWINSDGFYTNVLDHNKSIGGDAALTVRPTLLWQPADAMTVQFKYSFVDDQSDPTPNKYDVDPPASLFAALNPRQYANWGTSHLGPDGTGGPYSMGFNNICKCNAIKINSPSLKVDYTSRLGQLTAISGHQHIDGLVQTDATGTVTPLLLSELPYSMRVTTEEVRLLSQPGSHMRLISGVFYLADTLQESDLQYIVLGGPASITWKNSLQKRRSSAIFADGEYTLPHDVHLTVGARVTEEVKDFRFGAAVPVELSAGSPILPVSYGYSPKDASWHDLSPKVSLDHSLTQDSMIYASWSRGFKAGGFQALASSIAGAGPYGDETMDASEAGFKSFLWDHRARISADVFYEAIRGLQRAVVLLENGVSNNLTLNAANSISQGAEAELELIPVDALHIRANIGYLDAYYSSFCADFIITNSHQPKCGLQTGAVDNTNLAPSNAPRWSVNMSADYDIGLGNVGTLAVHADGSYTTSMWTADDNNPVSYRAPSALVNASVKLLADRGRFFVSMWGRNLTNRVVTEAGVMAYPLFSLWNPTPPRTFGLTIGANFGGSHGPR